MKTDYRSILKKYWRYDDFRGIQREIIESIGAGHDTLGLMPTGGGKSITFQVPALAQEGVCVVITPLIALMKDQVEHLKQKGIRAAAIHSDMSHEDVIRTMENAIFGAVKILYISPERLSSEFFRTKLRHMQLSFICVDEAHCISQWGYDFRPSYLEIADIRKDFPDIPILALTATATKEVVDDIQEKLLFRKKCVYRMSFERKNLAYVVRYATDKADQIIHILKNTDGSAIIYARSRQRTKEYAEMLNAAGLQATYFHAGLDSAVKDQRQRDWQQDKVRIMVATNAFGMGIDKPDVRVVIHVDCPSSIEAYFQEAGRAGRDGKKAYAVLIYNDNDFSKLRKRITDTFPDKDYIRKVYDCLAFFYEVGIGSGFNSSFEFPIEKFCRSYRLFPIHVDSALRILDRAGYIEYNDEHDHQARVMFILEREELYRLTGNSANEDKVIITLLRNYTGLFVDYVFIDEAFIAQQTELSMPVVYMTLKSLSDKHIIKFIPQRSTPSIRYKQRREDSEFLQFPPAIYEDLQQKFITRIEAMISYIATSNQCRSRQLLRYFGEENNKDCGQCDVCTSKEPDEANQTYLNRAKQLIIDWLKEDQEPHDIKELYQLPLSIEMMKDALQYLVDEKIILHNEGKISLVENTI